MKKLLIIISIISIFSVNTSLYARKPYKSYSSCDSRSHYRSPSHHYYKSRSSFFPGWALLLGLTTCMAIASHDSKKYYTYDGIYIRDNDYTVTVPPEGMIISVLPRGSISLYVNNKKYYCYKGIYYKETNHGYKVVPCPQNKILSADTIYMNIKSNGGIIPLTLTRNPDGSWTDSRGTSFSKLPSKKTLRDLYET